MDSPSFPTPGSSSSAALHRNFDRLSLTDDSAAASSTTASSGGAGFLQDEDMSLALAGGDDSFDFVQPPVGAGAGERGAPAGDEEETLRFDGGPGTAAKGKAPAPEAEGLFFGGSMASAQRGPSASQRFAGAAVGSSVAGTAGVAADEVMLDGAVDEEEDDGESGMEGYTEEERERIVRLRDERDGLRGMNRVLDGMVGALRGMEGKMQAFESTISTSHALLDLYSRIASQAEHTKDLLLNGEWEGVMKDYDLLAAREAEAEAARLREEQEAEEARRRAEEERRRAEEEDERRRRDEEARRNAPPGRGRGRGLRGVPSSSALRGGFSRGSSTTSRGRSPTTTTSTSFSPTSNTSVASGIPTRGSAPVSGVRGVRGLRSRVATAGARGGRGRGGE
ncbi:hypothetical protein Rhopal_007010-T1 [Rhodotorula paludigena]|uniref:DASH complex subunit DUO1 n=1 Tax=Rhodotorula paludigena TaxID=86838 RepID=A0AAV5GNN7_9BASI|nr:hypothetical protein Rhopal_007010-T1 [Rhodotorula paludigena]